jgi:hypothetical protein
MFLIKVPNKTGMEGFTRDLSNMVLSKNPLMVALNINHSGELRAIDGSDSPRNNQRGYWIKSPVRTADEPETDVELLAIGERTAEVSLPYGNIVLFSFHLADTMFILLSPGAINLAKNNSYNNLFIVDETFFINEEPSCPVFIDLIW